MKQFSLIWLFLLIVFFSQNVAASQFPPSPICNITAEIIYVHVFKKVDIQILSVGIMIDEGIQPDYKNFTCSKYENNSITEVTIRDKKNYKAGQKIIADFSYFGDEFSEGYVLDNAVIIEESSIKTIGKNTFYIISLSALLLIIVFYLFTKKIK